MRDLKEHLQNCVYERFKGYIDSTNKRFEKLESLIAVRLFSFIVSLFLLFRAKFDMMYINEETDHHHILLQTNHMEIGPIERDRKAAEDYSIRKGRDIYIGKGNLRAIGRFIGRISRRSRSRRIHERRIFIRLWWDQTHCRFDVPPRRDYMPPDNRKSTLWSDQCGYQSG